MAGLPVRLPEFTPVASLLDRIGEHARSRPAESALSFLSCGAPAVEFSWSRLQERIRAQGALLVRAGVAPGDILFVLSASPQEQVLGMLAAMAAGALPSILSYPSLKQSETRFHETLRPITLATGARWILSSSDFVGVVTRAQLSVGVLEFPSEEALASVGEAPALPAPSADFLQFSSGTTGLRKCVRITGQMLASQASAYARALKLGPEDRVVSWLPLYHDMGLVACLLVPLFQGHLGVHMSPFEWLAEPALLFKAISRYRASLVWLPNFAYKLCAEQISDEALAGLDLSSLRAFINCSEPVRHRSHQYFLERFGRLGVRAEHLQACYAMAETTFAVTQTELGRPVRVDRVQARPFATEHRALPVPGDAPEAEVLTFVSCGPIIEDMEIRIAEVSEDRRVGEIQIRGGSRIPGYGVDGRLGLEAFTQEGWYRTGDLGYRVDGELFVCGRAKDLIIHRGHNVYPNDVEEVVAEVPGCKPGRIVVFGLFDETSGTEEIIVMLEPEGSGVDMAELRRKVREQVWMRLNVAVTDVDVVEPGRLLKSTSGKLSRSSNRELYLERREHEGRQGRSRPAHAPPYVEPRDHWERQLAWIWEEVLGVRPVGIHDNLFLELGADSVSATRAAAEVQRRLSREVPPVALLGADTVERQAELLRGSGDVTGSPLVTLQRKGTGRPFFIVHAAGGWAFPYVTLVRHLGEERPVHAFQAPQLFRGGADEMTIESMAGSYLAAMKAVQPQGAYLLGGWSLGGHVAVEMARQLRARGEEVARLILFDTSPPFHGWLKVKARTLGAVGRLSLRLALRMPLARRLPFLRPIEALSPVFRFFIASLMCEDDQDIRPLIAFAFQDKCDRQRLERLDTAGAWDYVMELARANAMPADRLLLVPGLDGAGASRALRVARRLQLLNGRHMPSRPYEGRMDILAVRENPLVERWKGFVTGPVEIHRFELEKLLVSAHFDMMEEANVKRFVATLRQLLQDADR